jgi:hypothetical protein
MELYKKQNRKANDRLPRPFSGGSIEQKVFNPFPVIPDPLVHTISDIPKREVRLQRFSDQIGTADHIDGQALEFKFIGRLIPGKPVGITVAYHPQHLIIDLKTSETVPVFRDYQNSLTYFPGILGKFRLEIYWNKIDLIKP